MNTSGEGQTIRRFVYLLVIGLAGASAFAQITTTTLQYHPVRNNPWPKHPVHSPLLSANDRSRWCTVWSLVERGTYQIDEIIQQRGWNTIDKGRYQDHFYSSKPPFLPTLVAGLYWGLKRVTGLDLLAQTHETVHILLLIINWVPWLIALGLMALLAERYAKTDFAKIFLVVAAATGTLLTTFLTTFNNHSIAATSVIFALVPLLSIVNDERREWYLFALAGFWGAFAACCELPAALFGVALFVLLVRRSVSQTARFFVPAALIPLLFFFVTNWLCTGSLKPFYANFASPNDTFYRYVENGVPSYWSNPQGIDKGDVSGPVYLFHCTFGHHGIFSLTPIFLLTLVGWMRLQRAPALRTVGWLGLALTVWVLGFYLTQTYSYNYGGTTSGLRWAFWLIPFWLLALIPTLDEWGHRRWFQIVCLLLLAVSVYSVVVPRNNPWQHPWLMNVWTARQSG
ncbi:MAG: DUF2029 domain-containing protein [Planctomycetes bacterium]|nr:DUF2029 domain-containing protein [Planctomycetota bacterium]